MHQYANNLLLLTENIFNEWSVSSKRFRFVKHGFVKLCIAVNKATKMNMDGWMDG